MQDTHPRPPPMEYLALLAVLGWAISPWLPGAPWLVLFGAIGFRALVDRPLWAVCGAFFAGFAQLAWVMDAWTLTGGEHAWVVWLVVGTAQGVVPVFAVLLSTWVQRKRPGLLAYALSWGVAQGVADSVMPLPALHATLIAPAPIAIWPAALGGPMLVTAAIAALGSLLWCNPRRGVLVGFGYLLIGAALPLTPTSGRPLRAAVVQLDLHAQDARPSRSLSRQRQIGELVQQAKGAGAELIVLPEGAWPKGGDVDLLLETLADAPPTILGASAGDPPTNSMIGVEDQRLTQVDKAVLVPVWERRFLGVGTDRYQPGSGAAILPLSDVEVGVLVCVEDLVQRRVFAASAGEVLLAATNDSWNGPRAGSALHLAHTRLVAVSTGLWVLRPALNGPSAIVDSWGHSRWSRPWIDHGPGAFGIETVWVGPSRRPGRFTLFWNLLSMLLLARVLRR